MADFKDATLDMNAIEARANAATPGPWSQGDTDDNPDGDADCVYTDADPARAAIVGPLESEADAAFIAAARSDVPALVSRVRDLEALLAPVQWAALGNNAHPSPAAMATDAFPTTHDTIVGSAYAAGISAERARIIAWLREHAIESTYIRILAADLEGKL